MIDLFKHVATRPRMALSAAVGILAAVAAPGIEHAVTRALLGWSSRWHLGQGLQVIIDWHKAHQDNQDMRAFSIEQISSFHNSVTK